MIAINVRAGRALDESVDVLMIPVVKEPDRWSGIAGEIDAALGGEMKRFAAESKFIGSAGKTFLLPTLGKIAPRRVCLVGMGEPDTGQDDDKRRRGWADCELRRGMERAR